MEDERLIVAIGRIEHAVDRIERATGQSLHALIAGEQRHHRLAQAAHEAVAALDRLIGPAD